MKNHITVVLFILITCSLSAQDFEFKIKNSGLKLLENGLYEDEYGTCFEQSLLIKAYPELSAYRNRYSNKDIKIKGKNAGSIILEIAESQTGWEKVKAKDCESANTDDCMVWCNVTVPERIVSMMFFDDGEPINFKEFHKEFEELLAVSGYLVYSETSCDVEETKKNEVKDFLNNYYKGHFKNVSFETRLNMLQYRHDLPIGGMNFETLAKMGLL